MSASVATKARAACRPGPARKDQAACLLCPLAAICRARRTRAALDARKLEAIALARGNIDFVAPATAGDAGRLSAIA